MEGRGDVERGMGTEDRTGWQSLRNRGTRERGQRGLEVESRVQEQDLRWENREQDGFGGRRSEGAGEEGLGSGVEGDRPRGQKRGEGGRWDTEDLPPLGRTNMEREERTGLQGAWGRLPREQCLVWVKARVAQSFRGLGEVWRIQGGSRGD